MDVNEANRNKLAAPAEEHLMKKLNRALEVLTTRGDADSGYTLHGRRFDDPYAWLERLDDAETQAWIAARQRRIRSEPWRPNGRTADGRLHRRRNDGHGWPSPEAKL
jgi:hypothetical protein